MTVRSLAAFETVRLLRHPLLLAGVAVSLAMVVGYAGASGQLWTFFLMGGLHLVLLGATFAAGHRMASRSRRDGAEELYATLPLGARNRTAAQLLAVLAVFPVAAALTAFAFVVVGAGDGLVVSYEGVRRVPPLVELAQGPLAVVAAGVCGVLLGRVSTAPMLAPLLAAALVAAELPLAAWGMDSPLRWAVPIANDIVSDPHGWGPCTPGSSEWCSPILGFDVTGMAWHLLSLVLLGTAAATLAVAIRVRPVRAAA
jgi:hypothetical protein